MVKKITISVPDELHKKMEVWKKSINFSGVFQEAIADLIEKKENFQQRLKGDPKMEEIIERLKTEKAQSEKDYFELGKNEGLAWAKAAHYEEIKYVLFRHIPRQMPDDNNTIGAGLCEYFVGIVEENEVFQFNMDAATPEWLNEFGSKFLDGWQEGVSEFWYEVEKHL